MEVKGWPLSVTTFVTLSASEAVVIFCLMMGESPTVAVTAGAITSIPVFTLVMTAFKEFTSSLRKARE